MSDQSAGALDRYREILKLLKLEQDGAEQFLAEILRERRGLSARADHYRAEAAAALGILDAPSAGDLQQADKAARALRRKAEDYVSRIDGLADEIARREAALTMIIRKVTAVKAVIAKLEMAEALREEERRDDAMLEVVQLKRM